MQMLSLASALAVAALVAGCNDAPVDAPQVEIVQVAAAAAPQLEGMAYGEARATVLGLGWQPFPQGCTGGGTDPETCRQFPEIADCSGTGLGFCSMTFARKGECLRIVTRGGPPLRQGEGETVVDGVRFTKGACGESGEMTAADDASAPPATGATGFAEPICARLRREGIAKTVLIDEFIPGYPAALQDPAEVEAAALTPAELTGLVRGLACGAGLSGFGPDVPEAALPLFASERHGPAARAALRTLASGTSGIEATAARQFRTQIEAYARNARRGEG